MTEEQAKEVFKRGVAHNSACGKYRQVVLQPEMVEDLYQAFKARLKSEATCNCWSDKAVDR